MKRQVPGLAETARDSRPEIPDGIFLVRVDGAQFRWQAHKPFYVLRLSVLEPRTMAGQPIVGRVYCTPKAMWKLGWFLRDFLYDPELLAHEQVDEKALPGLRGVVKISHSVINGISLINLDGFAPARIRPGVKRQLPLSSTRRRGRPRLSILCRWRVLDPGLLLGYQALHELGTFLLSLHAPRSGSSPSWDLFGATH